MAKKKATRNPTDSTRRNTQAANKRLDALELKSHELANGLTSTEAAIMSIQERLLHLEQPTPPAQAAVENDVD